METSREKTEPSREKMGAKVDAAINAVQERMEATMRTRQEEVADMKTVQLGPQQGLAKE
jgi:hypothetical protein